VPAPVAARQLRDHAMVAMLIGRGLRRAELLALRVETIQQREEHCVIADLVGKAGHIRTVPIPAWVKAAVDAWTAAAAITEARCSARSTRLAMSGETACRQRCCETSSGRRRDAPASSAWRRTTCGAPVPASAILPAANWIKSSSSLGTCPSKRRSATSDANRSSELL